MAKSEKKRIAEENAWLMMLKRVPDNIFMLFFEDNPEMRYVAFDYEPIDEEGLRLWREMGAGNPIRGDVEMTDAEHIRESTIYGGKRGGSMKDSQVPEKIGV